LSSAREELGGGAETAGLRQLAMDVSATRYGAVEGAETAASYARFLAEHRGHYDGVVLCLPNFGDETGAIAALQELRRPILVQAYPDEIGRMGFADRRDAFCGSFR